jgi:DNA polymerase III sliding clamp (beta) subunit (PCNA family)
MIESLKFVQGAIARKNFVPALKHFKIADRKIIGFNGSLGLCAPVDIDFEACPRAEPFIRAITACEDTIALTLNGARLTVRSGPLKVHVPVDESGLFPDIAPQGRVIPLQDPLLPALAALAPFVATDASRPWAMGVLFHGSSAFATNNVVLLEYWLGFDFPEQVNIPAEAVTELLRIGEEPVCMQLSDKRLYFHYKDGRWLSTQLFTAQWPAENLDAMLNREDSAEQVPITKEFWEALDRLSIFCTDLSRVHFLGNKISTVTEAQGQEGTGASVECEAPEAGIFNAKYLLNLREVVATIGFGGYPAPVVFYGERVRGVICGIKI